MIKIYNILGNYGNKAEKGLVLEEKKKLLQKIQLYLKFIQEWKIVKIRVGEWAFGDIF